MKKIIVVSLFVLTKLITPSGFTYVDKEINVFKKVEIKKIMKEKKSNILKKYTGYITAYGPDCKGCSGITASGINVKKTIYYYDKKYGKLRIVAADRKIPFGTIVRIKYDNKKILAIVLDRGSAIGFNSNALFDLLYKSEKESNTFGKKKAIIEVLRKGF